MQPLQPKTPRFHLLGIKPAPIVLHRQRDLRGRDGQFYIGLRGLSVAQHVRQGFLRHAINAHFYARG